MKYLKRFNEELKSGTYYNAARKLKKMNQPDRADALKKWGDKVEFSENLVKWRESVEEFKPFGSFKLKVTNAKTKESLTGDFYMAFNFDADAFADSYESERENNTTEETEPDIENIWFTFFIGIVPTTEELMMEYNKVIPEAEFDNGFTWAFSLSIISDIRDGKVELTGLQIDNYDVDSYGDINFVDRPSAGKFKTILKRLFTDPDLKYPSGRTDVTTMYEGLERCVLVECGFSSDYGFELKEIGDFIDKKLSPNALIGNKGTII